MGGGDIAIVGLACRFPGARDKEQFWANLAAGHEAVAPLSEAQLRAAAVGEKQLADPGYVRTAALLADVDRFDPRFFGIRPQEAAWIDPQQRLLLEVAYEALEDAGHVLGAQRCETGVYATGGGITTGYLQHHHAAFSRLPHGTGSAVHIGNDKDFLATQLSFRLNLGGPSMSVQTACSSSLVALHLARSALLSGEIDMALVGGSCVRVPQIEGYDAASNPILSPRGRCSPFSSEADGTVFGSGVGVVVLRRHADALADGDQVYAVIKSTAVNNDGAGKIGFTASSVPGQAKAMVRALAAARIPATRLGYVECHGTATKIGDPLELKALEKVFQLDQVPPGSCAIGSVKANIGHLEQAAGMAGLIKLALMLSRGRLVPTINCRETNPKIDFDKLPFYLVRKEQAWPHAQDGERQPRMAGLNCLGIGGTNAFAVLAEPAAPANPAPAPGGSELLCLSARSSAQLRTYLERLADGTARMPSLSVRDLCHTINVSRSHHRVRFCAVVDRSADPTAFLRQAAAALPPDVAVPAPPRPLVYVCAPDGPPDVAIVDAWLADTRVPVFGQRYHNWQETLAARPETERRLLAFELALLAQLSAWGIRFARIAPTGCGEALARLAGDAGTAGEPAAALAPDAEEHVHRCAPPADKGALSLTCAHRSPSVDGLLAFLAAYLRSGRDLDWAAFYAYPGARKVSLPTYPFARESYWIEAPDAPEPTNPTTDPTRSRHA